MSSCSSCRSVDSEEGRNPLAGEAVQCCGGWEEGAAAAEADLLTKLVPAVTGWLDRRDRAGTALVRGGNDPSCRLLLAVCQVD